ncbi:MAG TPA: hypothetical protein PK636_05835, partial [bacterium]|nr:hypothetical protein [bacterium]
ETVLLVFGEERSAVAAALEADGFSLEERARRRESRTFRVSRPGLSFPAVLAGYGSASTAGALGELVRLGARAFVMAGTCGASRHYSLGRVYLLDRAAANPLGGLGAAGYFSRAKPGEDFFPDPGLAEIGRRLGLPSVAPGKIVSQDTFYGFGGVLDEQGELVDAGPAPVPGGGSPPGFEAFLRLYRGGKPYLLDMETAFFYALCSAWRGVRGVAVRGVSNHVPFPAGDYVTREKQALAASLRAAVEIVAAADGRDL